MVLPIQRSNVNVSITGEVTRTLLHRLIRTLPHDADAVAKLYAYRVLASARGFAPSSKATNSHSASGIPLSNNPHDTTLRDSLDVEGGKARYRVTMGAAEKWGRYIITGTGAHDIPAGGRSRSRRRSPKAALKLRARVSRIHRQQESLLGQMRQADDHFQGRGKAIKNALGHVQGYAARRPSTRNEVARSRRIDQLNALDDRLAAAEEALHDARVGRPQLVFPWEGAPVNGRGQRVFVGMKVHKLAISPNNFLGRARSVWGARFATSLRRLLEGQGVS